MRSFSNVLANRQAGTKYMKKFISDNVMDELKKQFKELGTLRYSSGNCNLKITKVEGGYIVEVF
ncbi:MAG: hypothetical protein QXZ59_06710 [Nitrososphaeria archaeon]